MLQAVQSTDACTVDLPAICVQNKLQRKKMALAPNHVMETSRSKFNSPGVSEVETALQLHSSEVETALQLHSSEVETALQLHSFELEIAPQLHSSEVETALQLHLLLWMWSGPVYIHGNVIVILIK